MKVSKDWLKELVNLNISTDEVVNLLPLRSIGTKEVNDQFIELDMKGYNRSDLLSLRGVANEIAAITDSQVNFKENDEYAWQGQDLPEIKIEIESETLSPVYCVAKIEGLKVDKSNPEWVKKLNDSGIRSVNNIADVTNLVMLEYGQPLHAFDAENVTKETILVRLAKDKEQIITLDGKKRILKSTDIVIADPEKAIGIAGVMGGQNTEVTDQTTTIILEAAIFDPKSLRKTGTHLGLSSEAQKRFYHGLTKRRLYQALDAAIRMYQELGGRLTAISIYDKKQEEVINVPLSLKNTHSLIGVELNENQIEEYLKKLRFEIISKNEADGDISWNIRVPYDRLDIEIEADLIEEVARMYGYEKIPATELEGELPETVDQSLITLLYDLRSTLVDLGLTEVQTYSYIPSHVLTNLEIETKDLVKISNPMSAETEYLRESLWPNLLNVTVENLKYFSDVPVFEIGKRFISIEGERPKEDYRLSIALANGTDNPIQELYSIFKKLDDKLGLKITTREREINDYDKKYFHPTRVVHLGVDEGFIGGIAEVHPRFVDKLGSNTRIAVLEIELTSFYKNDR